MTTFSVLSGRTCDLAALTDHERSALKEVLDCLRDHRTWASFGTMWPQIVRRWVGEGAFAEAAADKGSTLHRICEDLEGRVGIAEGRVAPRGYRDILADWIEERFPSRYAFCKQTGLDEGHLSRVLSGRKDLSIESFEDVLRVLGRRLTTEADMDGQQELREAIQHLRVVLTALPTRASELGLRRLAFPQGPPLNRKRVPA